MTNFIKNKSIWAVLISLMFTGFTSAQDTLSLSLQQCIEIALDESPTIKIAEKEIERTDYANKEKRAALFPSINASASYSRSIEKQQLFFMNQSIEIGTDNSFAGVLSAAMPIVSPTLWASLKMNEIDASLALEAARSSKISLINSITKAFYAVLLTQDSYKVFERTYQSSAENAKIINNKYQQGAVSEFEWIRADVQLRNAMTNLLSSESAVNMSKLQLKMLMGINMQTAIQPVGKLADYESIVFEETMHLSSKELDKNADLNQFDIKAKQLKQSLEIQKTTWLPSLSASFNYQYMSMPNDDVAIKDYYWFPTSSAGLTLSIPIFQGGSKHYKSKQLQVQMKALEDQRENLKRSIELQAITYTDNMIKAIEKMESGKKALSQAEKALTISQKMYDVGVGTYLDITNAELGYVQAGLSYNQSIYDFMSAKADLEKILGGTVN
ncbi:MAG: TolC family protein [Paludibacter sp.]|nr:TolC family protein [Paludibacter sp.]